MIIPIAEFYGRTKNSIIKTTIAVEKVDTCYFYLTERGERSMRYDNLSQAIADITEMYGKWNKFKILLEE